MGSAEALPILCVRYIRWERERERDTEREREREREKDGSDVTFVALKLAMSFALLLAKNVHLSIGKEFCAFPCQYFAPQFLTFWNALSSHFPLPKTLHFSKQFVFFALSNGVIDRGSKQQSTRSNFRLHRSSFSSKKSKKWIKLLPKTIGNRKRDCAWGCDWGINTTWENLQIEKHKSGRRSFRSPNWFVQIFSSIVNGGSGTLNHLLKIVVRGWLSGKFWRWCFSPVRVQEPNHTLTALCSFCSPVFFPPSELLSFFSKPSKLPFFWAICEAPLSRCVKFERPLV